MSLRLSLASFFTTLWNFCELSRARPMRVFRLVVIFTLRACTWQRILLQFLGQKTLLTRLGLSKKCPILGHLRFSFWCESIVSSIRYKVVVVVLRCRLTHCCNSDLLLSLKNVIWRCVLSLMSLLHDSQWFESESRTQVNPALQFKLRLGLSLLRGN